MAALAMAVLIMAVLTMAALTMAVLATTVLAMAILTMAVPADSRPRFQVWNPSNCEIWVLEAQPGSGKYGLAGRWRATPYGGSFTDIKFGEGRNQPLYEHMRRPSVTRAVTPGTPDALYPTLHP